MPLFLGIKSSTSNLSLNGTNTEHYSTLTKRYYQLLRLITSRVLYCLFLVISDIIRNRILYLCHTPLGKVNYTIDKKY